MPRSTSTSVRRHRGAWFSLCFPSEKCFAEKEIAASDHQLRGQTGAAGRGDKPDAQESRLHACDGARFASGVRRGVNRLILRVDIGHGSLQHQTHRRWRGAENRLPAHRRAGIRPPGVTGDRELAARLRASRKRFVVEAESYVARHERNRRGHVLIARHLGSFLTAAWARTFLRTHPCGDPARRRDNLGSTGFSRCRCNLGESCERGPRAAPKSKTPRGRRGATFYKSKCITPIRIVKRNFANSQKIFLLFYFQQHAKAQTT